MTGDEHYRKAEEILVALNERADWPSAQAEYMTNVAQVHATLAVASAIENFDPAATS